MLTQITLLAAEEPNGIILAADIYEVVWGTIAFVILVAALWKLAYQPLKQAMADRRERIAGELDEAQQGRESAEAQLEDVQGQLADAGDERDALLEDARRTADALLEDYGTKAGTDAVELRERALRDIAASQQQAMADLHASVGDLTLGAAEVVVRNNLDESTQDELIEKYIAQVANN